LNKIASGHGYGYASPGGFSRPREGTAGVRAERMTANVCLLDDDSSVLKATERLLCSAGWEVEIFNDPHSFLDFAREHRPPLAVIDIWMPAMSGLEVQKRLRCVSPATRVVVLTSKDDPSIQAGAMNEGAAAFFLKPADDEEFLTRLRSVLDER
jgi:FixJ family two-component response regulator